MQSNMCMQMCKISLFMDSLYLSLGLSSTDMHIFGHCPAHDDIYLVVCSHCGQVVKPQAFEQHCERRHGPLTKMCVQSSALAPQQRPRPARPASNHSSSRERQKDGRGHEAGVPSSAASAPVLQHRPGKAQKEAVRYCFRVFTSWQQRGN